MTSHHIAVLGTGSDVGKSIIAAGLCRVLKDQGCRVAPFKAQNMSNNSGITPDGLEMGRAQIVQAEAARIPPHVDMNPVLLKPTADHRSQIIVNGMVYDDQTARTYHERSTFFKNIATHAFDSLASRFDRIVLEGAGSCAEVNLMETDIVNFSMAEYAKADVILVADIHRGGVFAQIVGTLACLPARYEKMIKGIIINRFRGDVSLFTPGIDWLEKKTGIKILGVVPWFTHFKIDAEDSVEIETAGIRTNEDTDKPAIGIIRLPRIANFTDFHALSGVDGLRVSFIDTPDSLFRFKAIIIPGSKNTRQDLEWLKSRFEKSLHAYASTGGHILGICGGYQMLGDLVEDPDGLEGSPGATAGLGMLPARTCLMSPKTTSISEFVWSGIPSQGYEIHMGQTHTRPTDSFATILRRNGQTVRISDGCVSQNGRVAGTYIHGFFDSKPITDAYLRKIGIPMEQVSVTDRFQEREAAYTALKRHLLAHVDLQGFS